MSSDKKAIAEDESRSQRIAIGAIFKNEEPYILEWIAFHRVIGVDHFFIADNNSDDGTTELLADLDRAGVVEHIPFPGEADKAPQLPAYVEIMWRHRDDADWIAFIDADEFLLPMDGETSIRPLIRELSERPEVGALAINWACYGSGGQEESSDDFVIDRFSMRAEKEWRENFHYKSMVRTAGWAGTHGNAHLFRLKPGYIAVHPNGEEVAHHSERGPGLSEEHVWKRLRLNHYVVKSKQEFFEKKGPKGRVSVLGQPKGESYFTRHDKNEVTDPMPAWLLEATKAEAGRLQKLVQSVRKRSRISVRWIADEAPLLPVLETDRPDPEGGRTLAVAAIVKNEGPYLLEWIAFHRAVGVTQFFIADNESDDGTSDMLADLSAAGLVERLPFPRQPGEAPQLPAYRALMARFGGRTDWVAFIDADEFIVPTGDTRSIAEHLKSLDSDVGAVVLNWAVFGSSGQEKMSDGLVIERFWQRGQQEILVNHHFKSLVRPTAYRSPSGNSHLFVVDDKSRIVQSDGTTLVPHAISGLSAEVKWQPFRLNHYVTKSFEEYAMKVERGRVDKVDAKNSIDSFNRSNSNDVDDRMQDWLVEATKAELERLRAIVKPAKAKQSKAGKPEMESQPPKSPGQNRGCIDNVIVRGGLATLRGWALGSDNREADEFRLALSGEPVERLRLKRVARPDVASTFTGATSQSGFLVSFPVSRDAIGRDIELRAEVEGGDFLVRAGPDVDWENAIREYYQRIDAALARPAILAEKDNRRRIFVIGLNKCGTTSLHNLFTKNEIESAHFQYGDESSPKLLALTMMNNFMSGADLLSGLEKYRALSDISYIDSDLVIEFTRLYSIIHKYHPSDYFILNTRNIENWISSRFIHNEGSLVARWKTIFNCSESQVDLIWRRQFREHHREVQSFFRGNPRFLTFDIETDDPVVLKEFLQDDFDIDVRHWEHLHKTA